MTITTHPTAARRLDRLFLISTYLTVALACLCLAYAEFGLMPEIVFVAGMAQVLLLAAFLAEGKWSLSNRSANILGGIVAGLAGIWMAFRMMGPTGGYLQTIPWPASMLPFLGPMLMLLLPAKLLRPKTNADYWALHGIGLVCVGLGCVMADDSTFGLLLVLYLLCGVWSLVLFYQYREQHGGVLESPPRGSPRLTQVFTWIGPTILVALVAFFYTPRSGNNWQLAGETRRQMLVGMSEDPSVDLNITGNVEMNRDIAFEVFAEDNWKRPKLDLNPNQRWRGPVYNIYAGGRWEKPPLLISMPGRDAQPLRPRPADGTGQPLNSRLPDFGPNQFFLLVTIQARIGPTPFLAEPIAIHVHASGGLPVVQVLSDGRASPFYYNDDSTLAAVKTLAPGQQYRQVVVSGMPAGVSPPLPLARVNRTALFAKPAAPGVEKWTRDLLQRLVASGRLAETALSERTADGQIQPDYYEAVALALEKHLSLSGEYHYSLQLERRDRNIDPVLDFLVNVKHGECFRFASAMAVMLKSIGVPCQLVLGYRGADSRGDGHYDVRQCHAHAWVEVLAPREEAPPAHGLHRGHLTWRLVSFDPTPFEESIEASQEASRRWWNSSDWNRDKLFKDLFVNYSPDNREHAAQRVWEAVVLTWRMFTERLVAETPEGDRFRLSLVLLGLTAGSGALLLRSLRQRVRRLRPKDERSKLRFHRQLLAILARRGWKPSPGQTLREFTRSLPLRQGLPAHGSDVRQRIDRIAGLVYRVRFGNKPLDHAEAQAVQSDLRHLSRCLTAN
jgi:transglutaminase-like putative cysteine protease